jgi:hypothetical protein
VFFINAHVFKLKEKMDGKRKIKTLDGREYQIPKGGSLGLLALGYKGILSWKKVKSER